MQLPEYTHHSCTITTGYDTPCIRLEINDYVIEIFCTTDLRSENNKKHIVWGVWSPTRQCLGEGRTKSVRKAKKKAEKLLIEILRENILPM